VCDVFRPPLDGVDPALIGTAEAALVARAGVRSVRSVRMRWIGHRLHADAEFDVDPALGLGEAHRIAQEVEHDLIHAYPADDANNPAERQGRRIENTPHQHD
jgi:divalent metal cation (Fe/Co/Zn/Cd) transporter